MVSGDLLRPIITFMKRAVMILLVGLFTVVAGQAQFYLANGTLSGGGGTRSGGDFSLAETIGQSSCGDLSGGIYAVSSGVWGAAVVIPTLGRPRVIVAVSNRNFNLSWSVSSAAEFTLEQTSDLEHPNTWSAAGVAVATNGAIRSVSMPISQGYLFFRLRQTP